MAKLACSPGGAWAGRYRFRSNKVPGPALVAAAGPAAGAPSAAGLKLQSNSAFAQAPPVHPAMVSGACRVVAARLRLSLP